ncbi:MULTISPECIES: O-antigen ligase family protein [unclassified Nocardioides]|uniref:O-antigen ligase family protein n=1 Tax=unclassified Nocardioides TaxID=2615069 RepID=UPI0012E37D10|nr:MULTISPECIES: O-antigen ligase family protein [unclassified Nocardioides]
MTATAAGPARRVSPPPRRTAWTVVVPLLAAVVLGALAGFAALPVLLAALALVVGAAVVLRLEWVALALVAVSVFEDYAAHAGPGVVKGLAVLLVVAWLIRRCRGRLHHAPRSPVLVAALAFVVVLLLATALHNNGAAGRDVLLRYAGFLAVLFVLADVLRGGLRPARLAQVYVVAAAAAAVCGLLTFALGADRRVGGPIGDPNDFAFFLLPAVALGLAVRRTTRRSWPWDAATVVVLVATLGTLSRGALVGLSVMAVLAVAAGMIRLRGAVALVAVVSMAAGLVAVAFPGLVSVSLQQKDFVAQQNVSERLDLWTAAAEMTVTHPVLGMGPGAFALHHRDFTTSLPDDINHPLDVAHNTWLELSSELGVLGFLAFLAMLVVAFAQAWSVWRRRRDPVAAAVCVGLVGTAASATFVTEQYYLPMWLLCALAVGVAAHADAREDDA